MVDNIQSTGRGQLNPTETQEAAKDQLFPGSDWSKSDMHKCIGQWVNKIVQTIHSEQAQMKKADQELKKSEEG